MSNYTTHNPSDCTLLVGIPVTLREYDLYKSKTLESDFLERCCQTRLKFFNEVCVPVGKALPTIVKYGCQVILSLNEKNIKTAFQKEVLIFFTHWSNNSIEINGKMIPDPTFCKLIPTGFNGIIDLCACQPEDHLVVSIKKRAPNSTVKCTLTKITPSIWIEIIRLTLYLISKHKLSYTDASVLVLKQIFKRYNNFNL